MRIRPFCLIVLSLFCTAAVAAKPPALNELSGSDLVSRQTTDLRAIETYRSGLDRTIAFARAQIHVFPDKRIDRRLLTEADKKLAREVWKSLLDYQLALEAVERFHADFLRLTKKSARDRSLLTTFAAHTARYRFALDFIDIVENDSELGKVLNEAVAELGLERGAYDRFKFYFLNVVQGGQFAALSTLHKAGSLRAGKSIGAAIDADSKRLWQMGAGKGTALTFANALAVVGKLGLQAVFPVQAGISEWMGDTRVARQHQSLISEQQVAALIPRLQPGDVMLQRREWYVSNVGLPGFWSHAALYIGTAEERRNFFDDAEVRAWAIKQGAADGNVDTVLRQRHPVAYKAATSMATVPHPSNEWPRVLEAISEGVSFTSIEHSAAADSLVVLRPRLSKADRAYALLRAFGYAGRPYDFDFDFQTDSSIVCTELIYKAYEPAAGFKGITMQPQSIVGRLAIPANEIARAFDAEFGTPTQQWDMIAFLDGIEREKRAVEADVAAFRASWPRPKWHVLLPDATPATNGATR